MAAINYKVKKLNTDITLKVQITTEYKIRKWIAMKLIQLAVFVLGCGLEIVE
jgi:hypothetical protein